MARPAGPLSDEASTTPTTDVSPYHPWKRKSRPPARWSPGWVGLFAGKLKKIAVTKRGDSPRIVKAKLVGTGGTPSQRARLREAPLGLHEHLGVFRSAERPQPSG